MTWRYGVTREKTQYGDVYAIREIYTDEDGAVSWTARPVGVTGDSVEELREALMLMSKAARSGQVLDITEDHENRSE